MNAPTTEEKTVVGKLPKTENKYSIKSNSMLINITLNIVFCLLLSFWIFLMCFVGGGF